MQQQWQAGRCISIVGAGALPSHHRMTFFSERSCQGPSLLAAVLSLRSCSDGKWQATHRAKFGGQASKRLQPAFCPLAPAPEAAVCAARLPAMELRACGCGHAPYHLSFIVVCLQESWALARLLLKWGAEVAAKQLCHQLKTRRSSVSQDGRRQGLQGEQEAPGQGQDWWQCSKAEGQ